MKSAAIIVISALRIAAVQHRLIMLAMFFLLADLAIAPLRTSWSAVLSDRTLLQGAVVRRPRNIRIAEAWPPHEHESARRKNMGEHDQRCMHGRRCRMRIFTMNGRRFHALGFDETPDIRFRRV